ncbi:MAG: alkyl hydroperoxide reductase subunit F [Deltaproteobacteria bacterium]|nr:MAG: alkyl hydroperoxide reductase subunit F [Deltaproteobacteria bacterium]
MLEQGIIDQLKTVFEVLEGNIDLVYEESSNEKQKELVEMLEQVASTSENISAVASGTASDVPAFEVRHNGKSTGIIITGIPGGHEFTSLILAILNSDGKGKLPDEMILKRIGRLKGPVRLRSFISLSCENCPEVVQALNLMAVFHPDFKHEMVDGGFVQEEVEKLGIQGVPSVIHNGELLSSGKTDLLKLLGCLEDEFGTSDGAEIEPVDLGQFEVAVIGGGPAGASAAIYCARKGLKTILIAESFGGQVKETKGIENLISVPYTEGPELSEKLFRHVSEYDIKVLEHRKMTSVETGEPLKKIQLDSGEYLETVSLIIATGAKWRELNVPGEKEYLGRGVAFCPHCDGPYYKGKDIAVIGGGNSGIEAAIDLAGIVKSVTVFEAMPELKADRVLVEKAESLENISILKGVLTKEILGDGDKATGIRYKSAETDTEERLDLDGVFVQIGLIPNSEPVKGVVETNTYGEIIIDDKCRTSVKGIYAAGDVTTVPYKQIVISMGEGAKAALTAFEEQVLFSI